MFSNDNLTKFQKFFINLLCPSVFIRELMPNQGQRLTYTSKAVLTVTFNLISLENNSSTWVVERHTRVKRSPNGNTKSGCLAEVYISTKLRFGNILYGCLRGWQLTQVWLYFLLQFSVASQCSDLSWPVFVSFCRGRGFSHALEQNPILVGLCI